MDFDAASDADSRSPLGEFGQVTTHTLIGDAGEVHVFWHNSARPVYLHVGGYGIRVASRSQSHVDETEKSVSLAAGTTHSALRVLEGPAGSLYVKFLQPRSGWRHAHLYEGQGAFPYWRSKSTVAPGVAVVAHVDGGRGHPLADAAIQVTRSSGCILVGYDGAEHRIPFPF
jgi:hypothetical protein